MKQPLSLLLIATVLFAACTRSHITGGQAFVACNCYNGAWKPAMVYNLGYQYPFWIDTTHINPFYTDSCNTLKAKGNFDSSNVAVIAP